MRIPYIAHIPFVLLFLLFTICFIATHRVTRRR